MAIAKFRKAQRSKCKASIAIEGLSGTGKSGLALTLAYYLSGEQWDKVYAVDTENRALDLYVGTTLHTGVPVGQFNIGDLDNADGYKPSYYKALRAAAVSGQGGAIINDSLSHCWQYEGGILTMVNNVNASSSTYNKYSAWGDPAIVKEKNTIMELVRSADIHVISTIRTKEKMELVKEDDRTVVRSLGEQQIMMPDFKYEPDLVLQTVEPGSAGTPPVVKVIKTRYAIFTKDTTYEFTDKLALQLKAYLEEGTSPEELLAQQHADYVSAVQEHLKQRPNSVAVWKLLLANAGHADKKAKDLSLTELKILFGQLIAD